MEPGSVLKQIEIRRVAREELKRKLEQEEEDDIILKKMHSDQAREQEECQIKEAEMKESIESGQWILQFGKYRGEKIADIEPSYLFWMLGYRLQKNIFVETHNNEALPYIRENHQQTLNKVNKFLTWRCWTCHSQNTRFKTAKLCTDCWKKNQTK